MRTLDFPSLLCTHTESTLPILLRHSEPWMCRALSSSTAPALLGVCSVPWLLQVTVQRCFKNPHPNPSSTACWPTGPSTVVTTGLLISPVSKTERGAPQGQVWELIRNSSLISSPSSQKGEGDNSQSPRLPAVQGAAVSLGVCRAAPPHLARFVCSCPAQPSTLSPSLGEPAGAGGGANPRAHTLAHSPPLPLMP